MTIALTVEFKQIGAEKLSNDFNKIANSGNKLTSSFARTKIEAESLRKTADSMSILNTSIAKAADAFEKGQRGLKNFIGDIRGGINALQLFANAGSLTSLSITSLIAALFDFSNFLTAILNPDKLIRFFDATKQSIFQLFGLTSALQTQAAVTSTASIATQTFVSSLSAMLIPLTKIIAVISLVAGAIYAVYRSLVIIEQETHILSQLFNAVKQSLDIFIKTLGLGSSAGDFFAKVLSSLLVILRQFVNYIVFSVATALQLFLRGLSLLSSFLTQIINIIQKVLAVFNIKIKTIDAAKEALSIFSKRTLEASNSLNDVKNKALNAEYSLKNFRDGVSKTTQDIFDFNNELKKARKELEQQPQGGLKAYLIDLREQIRIFQAEGKNYLATIAQIKAADIAKKIKPENADYETLKKLETDAQIAKATVKKEIQDIVDSASKTKAKIKIDAEIEKGNIEKAMQTELATDARLTNITRKIKELSSSGVPEAQEMIKALKDEYSAIASEIKSKYTKMLQEIKEKNEATRKQMLDDVRKINANELDEIDKRYADELKKLQQALENKLITQNEYEQKSAELYRNYEKQRTDYINEENKRRLEQVSNAFKELELPVPEGITKALDVINDDIRKSILGDTALIIEELRKKITDAQTDLENAFKSISENSKYLIPVRKEFNALKSSALELQKQIYLLSAGASNDINALIDAFEKYINTQKQFSNASIETIERMRNVGDIGVAEGLEKIMKDLENINIKVKNSLNSTANTIISLGNYINKAMQIGIVLPISETTKEVAEVLKGMAEEIERQMKENASIFERYNFSTIQGITEAFNDFVENFQAITPGKVFSEIVAWGFDRRELYYQAKDLGEIAARQFADGFKKFDFKSFFSGIWKGIGASILHIFSKAEMLITLVDFFSKPTKEFREGLDKFVRNIFYAIERISKNLPTFLVTLVANIPRFIVKFFIDLSFRLFPTLIALIPLMVNRFIFAIVESIKQAIPYLGKTIKYTMTLFKSTIIELIGSVALEIITKVNPILLNAGMILASLIVDGFNAYLNIKANRIAEGIANASKTLATIVASTGNLIKKESNSLVAYTIAGYSYLASAIANFTIFMRLQNKNSFKAFQVLWQGLENTFVGAIMLLGNTKREIAEFASAIIIIFSTVRAAASLLVGDFAGAAQAFFVGLSSTLAILQAAGEKTRKNLGNTISEAKKFNDQFEIKMKVDVEDESETSIQKIMEKRVEQAKKLNELQNKRIGSAEFKVKDVQELEAEKQISQLALSTADAVKNTADTLRDSLEPLNNFYNFEPPDFEIQMPDIGKAFEKLGDLIAKPFIFLGDVLYEYVILPFRDAGIAFGKAFKIMFSEFFDSLSEFFEAIPYVFKFFYDNALVPFATMLGDFIVKFSSVAWDFIVKFSSVVWDFIKSLAIQIGDLAVYLYNKLVEFLPAFGDALYMFIQKFSEIAVNIGSIIFEKLFEFIKFLSEIFAKLGEIIFNAIFDLTSKIGSNLLDFVAKFGLELANQAIAIASVFGAKLFEFASIIAQSIANNIQNLAIQLRDKIIEGFNSIGNIFYDYIILPLINAFNEYVITPIKNIIQSPSNAVSKAGSWVGEQAKKVSKWLGFSHGGIVPVMKKLPIYYASAGMVVPGTVYSGNSIANDKVPAMLSAGEIVLPNSITQRPDLMRDIAAIISGEPQKSTNIANIVNTSNIVVNQQITINIEPKSALSRQEIEKEIAPVIIDAIKNASERGKAIVSKRGLY